jgi:protein SCO1/2
MAIRRSRLACLLLLASLACCSAARTAPDFTLRSDAGGNWELARQRGDSVLLAFAYTHCADTCPALIARLERVTQTLGPRAARVQIAVVTVDPARDTPARLHQFLARFAQPGGSQIVGLTGTIAQVARVERAYHVWAQVLPAHRGAYDVAHSSVVFIIDPRGAIAGLRDDDDSQRMLLVSLEPTLQ